MARPRAHTTDDLSQKALQLFWHKGYHATSVDDLVRATGVSKHGIYTDFGGKRALFLSCFARYQDLVVSPAFQLVEAKGADLRSVAQYFEAQIALAEASGLPALGCFVGNSATEVAPHDAAVNDAVTAHNTRLFRGFRQVMCHVAPALPPDTLDDHALTLVIFAQGLWAMSRTVDTAAPLRRAVAAKLLQIEGLCK
jgi:TetR/AcrR family transcriptional regulator, transcriptional repressor for nem operon